MTHERAQQKPEGTKDATATRPHEGQAPIAQQIQRLGPSRPLDSTVQSRMEPHLGASLSHVRVHDNPQAARETSQQGARAMALGSHVAFGRSQYRPGTLFGDALIAHELAHVVQQGSAARELDEGRSPQRSALSPDAPTSGAERSADAFALHATMALHAGAHARAGLLSRPGVAASSGLRLNRCIESCNDSDKSKDGGAPVPDGGAPVPDGGAPVPDGGAPPVVPKFGVQPEDTSVEMIGKRFTLSSEHTEGPVTLASGTVVKATGWNNDSDSVPVTSEKDSKSATVPKSKLRPLSPTTDKLYDYHAGVKSQAEAVEKADKDLAEWRAKESQYKSNRSLWEAELARLEGLSTTKHQQLNKKLIQETMFNQLDPIIESEVASANAAHGYSGNQALDPNIVKSMIFQESQMGTSGEHLEIGGHPVKTRFNVGQMIDSSGNALLLLFETERTDLLSKHGLANARADLAKAQKGKAELEAKKSLTDDEKKALAKLKDLSKRSWESFFWSYPGFQAAVDELFAEDTGGHKKNEDYQFWIHMMVMWLFEKRSKTSSWAEAIRAYNGSGARAEHYKDAVIKRRDAAKKAPGTFTPSGI